MTTPAEKRTSYPASKIDELLDAKASTADLTNPATPAGAALSATFGALDEDDLGSDSETLPPTQQSVKAYIDSVVIPPQSFVLPFVNLGLPMPPGRVETSGTGALDYLYFFFVPCPHPVQIDALGISISTAEASATPRLGMYSIGATGKPDALLVDAGTVDASTTGDKMLTFTAVDVTQGGFYFAVAWQGAASALRFKRYYQSGGNTYPRIPTDMSGTLGGGHWAWSVSGVSGSLASTTDGYTLGRSGPSVPTMFCRVSGLL